MARKDIDASTLRSMLEQGKLVTVLDVRKAEDRAEWQIPASVHFDAYGALKAKDPSAMEGVDVPSRVPVVTVCGAGNTARWPPSNFGLGAMRRCLSKGG